MIDLNKFAELDMSDMDRTTAVLIYENKVYFGDNHQYALEEALNDDGKSMELDLEKDEEFEKAIDLTYNLSKHNDIITLDIYRNYCGMTGYLISHFEEHLNTHLDIIEEIAINENLVVGTFTTFPSYICKIFEDQPNAEQAS